MSLLERFQAGSEFDSHGEFTLDESKAREKMARFQLVTTEEFLMLVAQAVAAADCRSLAVTVEGNRVSVVASDALLDAESVEQISGFLFDSQPDNAAYHLLAVAANAIEPACQEPPVVAMVEGALEFRVLLKAELPQLPGLISTRLRHFPCPLSLNGALLETDPLEEPFRVELSEQETSDITLVRHGVVVSRQNKSFDLVFRAVAVADHLQLDASFSHVVEDDEHSKLMVRLRQRANGLLAEVARAYQPEAENRDWLLTHLLLAHHDPARTALEGCRFFPLADRPGYLSLSEIRRQIAEHGHLSVSQRRYNTQLPRPVVRLDDPRLRQALQARLSNALLQDADREYLAQVTAEKNRARWDSSPRPTELPPGARYFGTGHARGKGWEAAIGFLASPGGAARVEVLYLGKLLTSEPLVDVPPGATAVLNVSNAQVDPSWSRLEGREYRRILKELGKKLQSLFHEQTGLAFKELYPELRVYLLRELQAQSASRLARSAPLFPTLGGKAWLSLDELAATGEKVAVGEPVALSEKIPPSLLPSPMVTYNPGRHQALLAQLGGERVFDARGLQNRLLDIDRQMTRPRAAELMSEKPYLAKEAFSHDSSHGEIGLLPTLGDKLELTLLQNGVAFETVEISGRKVLKAEACLDARGLELNAGWTGFARGPAFQALLKQLRWDLERMESDLWQRDDLPASLRLKLLQAYPQPKEAFWERPLWESTAPGRFYSLQQLQAELAEHGKLLCGEVGVVVPGRLTLVKPSNDEASFLQEQLDALRWEDAVVVLREYHNLREFEMRKLHKRIVLSGAYPLRHPLPQGRGEIAISLRNDGNGALECYVQGRFVCTKLGILPSPFRAALESQTFTLSSDFHDVLVPEATQQMLVEAAALCMLEAARHKKLEVQEAAWDYFRKAAVPEAAKAQFEKLVSFSKLEGGVITLEEIVAGRLQGFVGRRFSTPAASSGLILRLDDVEVRRLSRYLRRKLENLEASFQAEEEYQRRLGALPTALSPRLFQKRFQEGDFQADLGVSLNRATIGLDRQGGPVGYLRELRLPVEAIVYGAQPGAQHKQRLSAELAGKRFAVLTGWSEQLCLQWVKERADDPEILLELVYLSLREVSTLHDRNDRGAATTPVGEMAALLWDMPLFRRVDGTKVSGSALAATLSQTGTPLLLSESSFLRPSGVLSVSPGSTEHKILERVFGKACLCWNQASLLTIDTAEVAKSVKRLVVWGLAPLGKTLSAVDGFLKSHAKKAETAKQVKQEAPSPRDLLVEELKDDVRTLLGREHFRRSDRLFQHLDFGHWPLGPPLYRPRGQDHFRLNALHSGVRWLLDGGGDERSRRVARMLLLIGWVGMVNVASEQLTDSHEEQFLNDIVDRLKQVFAEGPPV